MPPWPAKADDATEHSHGNLLNSNRHKTRLSSAIQCWINGLFKSWLDMTESRQSARDRSQQTEWSDLTSLRRSFRPLTPHRNRHQAPVRGGSITRRRALRLLEDSTRHAASSKRRAKGIRTEALGAGARQRILGETRKPSSFVQKNTSKLRALAQQEATQSRQKVSPQIASLN